MDNKFKILFSVVCLMVIIGGGVYSTIGQYQDTIQQKEESIKKLNSRVSKLTSEKESIKEKLSEVERNYEGVKKDKDSLDKSLNSLKEDIEKIDQEKKELQQKLKREEEKNKIKKTTTSRSKGIAKNTGGSYRDFQATAYCGCRRCNGKWTGSPTASGTKMVAGRTIAVDPRIIPLGSKVQVEGMGTYIAEDTGSAIKGNIIDIFFNNHSEALKFGRRKIKLKVL